MAVLLVRVIPLWGLHWVPPIYGNCHLDGSSFETHVVEKRGTVCSQTQPRFRV